MNGKVARALRHYSLLALPRIPGERPRPLTHAELRAAKREWRTVGHRERGQRRRLIGRLLARAESMGVR